MLKIKIILITISLFSLELNAQIIVHPVLPSTTDPNINIFTNSSLGQIHIAALNASAAPRNLLFVFLPGTNGTPLGYKYLDSLAANMGYHCIGLMYPNSPSIGSLCSSNVDSLCFENVRMEIIDGIDRTSLINIDTINCIESRLIKLLKYLNVNYPSENWGQYLTSTGQIVWNKIVIGGHSQGGGHAGLIAKYHTVNRVFFLASPKDYNNYYGIQAPWYNGTHITPSSAYYGFSHNSDAVGSTPANQFLCYGLLGLSGFGGKVNVDTISAPYNYSHMLTTSIATSDAHGCVAVDNVQVLNGGVPIFQPVWQYMLDNNINIGVQATLQEENKFNLYPNPALNILTIDFGKQTKEEVCMQIYNSLGEVVLTINTKQVKTEIDILKLNSGLYFIGQKSYPQWTKKFIKQ